ncbi:MAG: GntR family transcriptional regulator [Mariniphaga sp.]|nr:GntR family transcriptional regulator [Mariniphaga sp.]
MAQFYFSVDNNSNILKFQQLVDAIVDSISRNQLKVGEMLPSVNQLMKDCQLSRDTVFKAYAELKQRGIVESVPNRGYFVAKKISKVFLFLDTFKAYKEVLYGSFRDHLSKNTYVDLNFHHYNIKVFESIINDAIGKYSKYVIMNFDRAGVQEIIAKIPKDQLLIIDWKINSMTAHSFVAQDFGKTIHNCFSNHIEKIKNYKRFIYYYPTFTYHPKESIEYFEKFCDANKINFKLIFDKQEFQLRKGDLFFLVSDRTLAKFLDQCHLNNFILGKDVGVISYNETPMKKYVENGITVISTDFIEMGQKAAEFVNSGEKIQFVVPTVLKLRSSL